MQTNNTIGEINEISDEGFTPIFVVSDFLKKEDPFEDNELVKVLAQDEYENLVNNQFSDEKLDDIEIKVIKSDSSSEVINLNKNMISSDDYNKLSNEGTYTITISYENCITSLTINIIKPEDGGNTDDKPSDEPIEYSVLVVDIASKPLSEFYITFYLDGEAVAEGYTGNSGTFKTTLEPNKYEVFVEGREGYYLNNEVELKFTNYSGGCIFMQYSERVKIGSTYNLSEAKSNLFVDAFIDLKTLTIYDDEIMVKESLDLIAYNKSL